MVLAAGVSTVLRTSMLPRGWFLITDRCDENAHVVTLVAADGWPRCSGHSIPGPVIELKHVIKRKYRTKSKRKSTTKACLYQDPDIFHRPHGKVLLRTCRQTV